MRGNRFLRRWSKIDWDLRASIGDPKGPDGRAREWLKVFLRVNNRKRLHTYRDVLAAGYPMADYVGAIVNWREVHAWCRGNFGRRYVWFGHIFFFTTVADRDLFLDKIKTWPTLRWEEWE